MDKDVAIIGAGVAGLRCALELQEQGLRTIVLEASDRVGGRIKTDQIDGFRLDHGFQVLLTAYDECRSLLNYGDLKLGNFEPGASVWTGSQFETITDPWRRPGSILRSAASPIGSIGDKLKIAKLRQRLVRKSKESIYANQQDQSTIDYLIELGYSQEFIGAFLRPFYGGIFLEQDLATSRVMFDFVFKMFAQGYAALPAGGMERIPQQLRSRLSNDTIRLNTPVSRVAENRIFPVNGSEICARHTVIATDMTSAARLVDDASLDRGWNPTSCLYFAAPRSPFSQPYIALNGSGRGSITNIAVPSDVAQDYAPAGKSLLCVSTRHPSSPEAVESELATWFGPKAKAFRFLKQFDIPQALPRQNPGDNGYGKQSNRLNSRLWICGDHQFSASIEGAMASGRQVAEAICQDIGNGTQLLKN